MRLLLAGLMALFPAAALAAVLQATPATLSSVWKSARSGDTIVLSAGSYVGLDLRGEGRIFSPRVRLDARAATAERIVLRDVFGLDIQGGTWRNGCVGTPCYQYALRVYRGGGDITISAGKFYGPEQSAVGQMVVMADGYGVGFDQSKNVEVSDSLFWGFKMSSGVQAVDGFRFLRNRYTRMRSDGINVAMSWNGLIERNVCDATRITADEHPDCIQLWSRPNYRPVSDIVIRGNIAAGDTQGIGGFNHVRLQPAGYRLWTGEVLAEPRMVDDGGFDRLLVEDNFIAGGMPQGIGVSPTRDSVFRNNRVVTLAASRFFTNLNVSGTNLVRCGNVAEPALGKRGVQDPPCGP